MSSRPSVAIVGGGVAGALTALQLARSASAPDVVLVDRSGSFARGTAYSTSSGSHLLNVPAARMSLFAEEPEHFLAWARRRLDADIAGAAFLPRGLFGDYVAETLAAATDRDGTPGIRLVHATAVDLEVGSPVRVRLQDGATISADRVVVALGNAAPADPPVGAGTAFYASERYTGNPWAAGALAAIAPSDPVLLVGSGLTMYDVALALRDRGHRGMLHALSRRGLLPRPHDSTPRAARPGPAPDEWLAVSPMATSLLRAFRTACAESGDWRAVVDSLRAVTGRLWQRLDERERARFLARLRPFWDVHRHRAPLAVHRRIEALLAGGVLRVQRGRIRGWTEDAAGVTALLDGGGLRVAHVVNCTGPDTDVARSGDPLVRALLARGLIVRDRHGLGVDTAADGALVAADGRVSSALFTLGTWRRAELWESVAVPELRAQAAALAHRLAADPPEYTTGDQRSLTSAPASPERSMGRATPAYRHGEGRIGELHGW